MKVFSLVISSLSLVLVLGCSSAKQQEPTKEEEPANQKAGPVSEGQKAESVKKVSFTLYHQPTPSAPIKPFGEEEIGIFPIEAGGIRVSDDKRLGLGKTDASGRATIEFRSPAKYSEYVLLLTYNKGVSWVMLRSHEFKALTFKCDGSKSACELGDVVFEVFEFK